MSITLESIVLQLAIENQLRQRLELQQAHQTHMEMKAQKNGSREV